MKWTKTYNGSASGEDDAVSVAVDSQEPIRIYPNPCREYAEILIPDKVEGNVTLVLTDISGKEVRRISKQLNRHDIRAIILPTGILDNGVYFCILRCGEYSSSAKLVVSN